MSDYIEKLLQYHIDYLDSEIASGNTSRLIKDSDDAGDDLASLNDQSVSADEAEPLDHVFRPTIHLESRNDEMSFPDSCETDFGSIASSRGSGGGGLGGSGVSVTPYTIYFANDTTATITEAQIAVGQVDNWGITFPISTDGMTGLHTIEGGTDRFVGDAPQTAYYLPVYIGGVRVSTGGLYQEDGMCDGGTAVIGLIKVG